MIIDKIENAHLYTGLSRKFKKAFKILTDDKLIDKPDGRYEIDGDNIFYIIQRYITKPHQQGRLESHRKYIDIQFIAAGRELLGFSMLDNLEIVEPYSPERDIAFYKVAENINFAALEKGMFCVLFPDDAHMPGLQLNDKSNVTKVVVKVKIDG